ncbi:hypothetical protein [Sphingobacterium sp. 40-24]|nr:hypothetical protein [Sphingobacterium sp. 40-24]
MRLGQKMRWESRYSSAHYTAAAILTNSILVRSKVFTGFPCQGSVKTD